MAKLKARIRSPLKTASKRSAKRAKIAPRNRLRRKAAREARAPGANAKRVRAILAKLDEAYPRASCALVHEDPFQLLISTILSAQCTDERVNQVTRTLYQKYPTPAAFAYASPRELEQEIRPTGFFRNKTKSIMGASRRILEEFGGQVPRSMEEILTLPGVARKTANVVLGTAYGVASGIVVDTHVTRIAGRLDLTRHTDPKKIELDLMKIIPQEKWILFSHQVIGLGRRICQARTPRCAECNLESICYSKDKTV